MLRILTLHIALFLGLFSLQAQSWEIGLMGGGSNYHGDLAYNIVPAETKVSGGAFFKYNLNEYWSVRPTISYLQFAGSDANFKENNLRNLSFRNTVYELGGMFEFNFQPFSIKSIHKNTTFYAMAGIAAFKHKPEALYKDEWHDLHAIKTESERYKLIQINVPFGVGVKHSLSKNFVLGLETGWRKTFTDYLDDVSGVYPNLVDLEASHGALAAELSDRSREVSETRLPLSSPGDMRGDPNLKDWYFQTALSISYRFTPVQCPYNRIHFFDQR